MEYMLYVGATGLITFTGEHAGTVCAKLAEHVLVHYGAVATCALTYGI